MPISRLRDLLESIQTRVDIHDLGNEGVLGSFLSHLPTRRRLGGLMTYKEGSSELLKRSLSESIDTQGLLTKHEKLAIQVCAIVLSFISLSCALVTVYWFVRMKKRFRHKLVIILILADILRSFWLFLFPVVFLASGGLTSSSGFCQASGFLTQTGIETADFAILFIAIHTALQVFHPTLATGPDAGLYKFRYYVYTFSVLVPPVLSSLAFIRGPQGYLSQGPTCSLPIRPFWYRLAISWIPRYTIMLTVLCIYIAIYIKVKRQFGDFSFSLFRRSKRLAKVDLTLSRAGSNEAQHRADIEAINQDSSMAEWQARIQQSEKRCDPADEYRISSGVTTLVESSVGERTTSSATVPEPWMATDMPQLQSHGFADTAAASHPVPRTHRAYSNALIGKQLVTRELRQRQAIILRHVKLLFIYPLVYLIIWTVPFIQHSFNYSNNRAQHPIFGLFLVSIICISSIGTADSIIFCLREKPWRHIPGSDNTFWGSFVFWRVLNPDNVLIESQTDAPTITSSFSQRNASSLSNRSADLISTSRHSSLRPAFQTKRLSQLANLANVQEEDIDPMDRSVFSARDFAGETPPASQTSAGSVWTNRGGSHARTPTREWFDRRLSVAVGRSSMRGSDVYDDPSPSTQAEEP